MTPSADTEHPPGPDPASPPAGAPGSSSRPASQPAGAPARPAVVAVLVGLVAWPVASVLTGVAPTLRVGLATVACMLAAVEGDYAERLLRSRKLRGLMRWRYRAVELVGFLVLLKTVDWAFRGWQGVVADVSAASETPWMILDYRTGVTFVLVTMAWLAGTRTAAEYEEIRASPELQKLEADRLEPTARRFLRGGLLLVVAAGLEATDVGPPPDFARPIVTTVLPGVLLYFALGLVALTNPRLALLRRRWRRDRVPVPATVVRRARASAAALLGVVVLVAVVAPNRWPGGVLGAMADLLGWLGRIIGSLLGDREQPEPMDPEPFPLPPWMEEEPGVPEPPPAEPPPPEEEGWAWPEWLVQGWTMLFWASIVLLVVYVAVTFLRDRSDVLRRLAALRPIAFARNALRALAAADLLGGLRRWIARVRAAPGGRARWARGAGTGGPEAGRGAGWRRRRGRTPRDQVVEEYLRLLRRAGRRGHPRQPAQTPAEYGAALGPQLPSARDDLDELTTTFVEARFSPHTIGAADAERARASSRAVRAALRGDGQTASATDGRPGKPGKAP